MSVESTQLLLARGVMPARKTAISGGSPLDLAYTTLNQAIALAVILAISPLLAYIAFRIWREDGAPITFGHFRVGQRGELFRCLKFRTMVRNSQEVLAELLRTDEAARAEWARDQKLRNDPRVTPIGNLLRKTSLDELPQLFNILRGEMHFVGPRPVTIEELSRYGSRKRHYLSVRPGLTGLWQVSGRNNTTYDERVQFDSEYVERRNPLFDAWIVLRTVKVLVTREGAH
jgi:lipopolysaccharide/colanic/teichoic acid biosynthesis glycosyltransferase